MSNALFAQGTKLFIQDLDNDTWLEVPETRRVNPPEAQSTFVEVTHLNSPNNDDEFIKGLNRKGNLTFECAYQPTNAVIQKLFAYRDLLGDEGKFAWCVQFPDASDTIFYGEGFMESVSVSSQTGNDLMLSGSIKPTGALNRGTGGSAGVSLPLA